jgi:DNA-directed RNA polymerase subunit beta'
MAKELRDIYGGGLDPRHFEIIAKNLIKYVEIIDPGETGFLPGDKVNVSEIAKFLNKKTEELPVDKAEGGVLAKPVHTLTPGTLLDGNHIAELKDWGVKTVHVTNSGLRVVPLVPGLQTAKLLDPNWISKLSFSRLKDTLQNSAAIGAESDLHSVDPITPYIMGSEFGEGENGRY